MKQRISVAVKYHDPTVFCHNLRISFALTNRTARERIIAWTLLRAAAGLMFSGWAAFATSSFCYAAELQFEQEHTTKAGAAVVKLQRSRCLRRPVTAGRATDSQCCCQQVGVCRIPEFCLPAGRCPTCGSCSDPDR